MCKNDITRVPVLQVRREIFFFFFFFKEKIIILRTILFHSTRMYIIISLLFRPDITVVVDGALRKHLPVFSGTERVKHRAPRR